MKQIAIILILVAIAAAGWYFLKPVTGGSNAANPAAASPRGGQPVPITVAPVRSTPMSATIEAIGTARANESVTITVKVTDKISAINFNDGDRVEKGALLVELTNAEQTAQLGEAKADLDEARSQLSRLMDLADKGTVSKSDVDEARARFKVTSARLEAIVARLQDRVVRAPFSGVLGFRQISPGTLVSPGTPITTLDDVSSLKLDFSIPEVFIGSVKPNATVRAFSPSYPGKPFIGVVTGIDSRIDEVTRSATIRARLPNEEGKLRPGMLLTVMLVTDEHEAMVVPDGAVIVSEDGAYVYVITDDGAAQRRPVTTGMRNSGLIEITAGLSEGERIAVLGLLKLRDGAKVTISADDKTVTADVGNGPES